MNDFLVNNTPSYKVVPGIFDYFGGGQIINPLLARASRSSR